MPRPALHDRDALLDAALGLAARQGGSQLSVAAVARAAGAPSGSVYHRFSGRPELLGELWLRTVARFQEGFTAALEAPDPVEARAGAAVHVVAWSRAHPDDARLLLRGPADCAAAEWPAALAERSEALDAVVARALGRLARRTGSREATRERLALVTVDVPYALMRRHLSAGRPMPADAEALVDVCARTLAGAAC